MATNPKPIIFKITEAGKQAALSANADTPKVQISLSQVAIGIGKYTPTGNETSLKSEIMKGPIVSGDIERASKTLRFSSDITSPTITSVYEVGLLTDAGVLFAVAASSSNALFTVHPDITFVMSYGLLLEDVNVESITVTTDPNGALSLVIMENHLSALDPHPQYLNKTRFQMAMQALYPLGYQYHSNVPINPKPVFDDILGIDTAWRRITGKIFVSSDPSDPFINDYGIVLGQRGITDLAASGARPHVYPLQVTHTFERYNPQDVIETVWKVAANKTSIDEGDAVRFTVTANNLPDGQILDWSVKEGTLNSSSNDITVPEKTENGTVILRNGQAVIDFVTTPDDNEAEPQKYVRLTVGAPANLSLNIPINDAGHNETAVHITQSTSNGLALDEYYKQQSGSYPAATEKVRFIVDAGVDIIAPSVNAGAVTEGANWPNGAQIIIENHGRILGRGGDGGRSAHVIGYLDNGTSSVSSGNIAPSQKGGNGGTAIKPLSKAIIVENHSLIAGGGGGGGGQGAWSQTTDFTSVGGGGGTGGGAPLGRRSPNEGTLQMYLEDSNAQTPRYNLPNDDRVYYTILISMERTTLQGTGITNEYHDYSVTAGKSRSIYVPLDENQTQNLRDDFSGVYYARYDGETAPISHPLMMSSNATIDTAGMGGYGGGETQKSVFISVTNTKAADLAVNHGGDGGAIGSAGSAGVVSKIFGGTTTKIPADADIFKDSSDGGLAGYIAEGSVTITNFGSGTTKGR